MEARKEGRKEEEMERRERGIEGGKRGERENISPSIAFTADSTKEIGTCFQFPLQ